MARVPGRGSVERVGLVSDPGLNPPAGAFDDPLAGLGQEIDAGIKSLVRGRGAKDRKSEEVPPLPLRKPAVPKAPDPETRARQLTWLDMTARRHRHSADGRREMAQAVLQVVEDGEVAPADLLHRVKDEIDAVLGRQLQAARQAGQDEASLLRLEAELGSQSLALLGEAAALQQARYVAAAEQQLEQETDAIVEAVRRNPDAWDSAQAALDELFTDFAAGLSEGALKGFAEAAEIETGAARVEGHLAAGALEEAAAVLDELGPAGLTEERRQALSRRLEVRRRDRPSEDQVVLAALRDEAETAMLAGWLYPAPPELFGNQEQDGTGSGSGRGATPSGRRRDWIERLALLSPAKWEEELAAYDGSEEERQALLAARDDLGSEPPARSG